MAFKSLEEAINKDEKDFFLNSTLIESNDPCDYCVPIQDCSICDDHYNFKGIKSLKISKLYKTKKA